MRVTYSAAIVEMIRALATQQTVVERRLEHLEDVVDRPLGDALADRDGDDPCEPAVFLRGGLEERDGPKVIRGRIDRLAPIDVLDHGVPRMPNREGRQCCGRDEGRPLGVGVQDQAPNPLTLRWSRASVVNGEEKAR